MNVRLARLALALYPLAHRRRYGEEMQSLVDDAGASPRVVFDLLRGAFAAHLRPVSAVAGEVDREERARLALGSILLCWFLFAAAGVGLYKTTEGHAFSHADDAHWLLGGAHAAIVLLAILGTVTVAVGATPLVLAAMRQGREDAAVRRAAMLAASCVIVFLAVTAGIEVVIHPKPVLSTGVAVAILVSWGMVALLCGLGCVFAARRSLAAISVGRGTLRASMLAGRVVALAMTGIALAAGVYLGAMLTAAPGLAGEGNGPGGLTSVGASLALQLGVMVVAASAAILSASRSRRTC
jgi:hypothetical protein